MSKNLLSFNFLSFVCVATKWSLYYVRNLFGDRKTYE